MARAGDWRAHRRPGIGRHGDRKPAFEPGVDIAAKVTIFCDGVRGNLTKELLRRLQLGKGRQPEQFALGIKELWEVPPDRLAAGTVIHTMGYPMRQDEFGGGFIYAMPAPASVGLVRERLQDPLFARTCVQPFKRILSAVRLAGGHVF